MILGIQTAGFDHGVVVKYGSSLVLEKCDGHLAEQLPGMVLRLCQHFGATVREITSIRVCIGPGGFTSLRSGIAYAQGLARVLNIPIETTTLFHLHPEKDHPLVFAQSGHQGIFAVAHQGTFSSPPQVIDISGQNYNIINDHPSLNMLNFFDSNKTDLPLRPLYVRPPDAAPARTPSWLQGVREASI